MWGFFIGFLIIQMSSAYGENKTTDYTQTQFFGRSAPYGKAEQIIKKKFEVETLLSELWDMASAVVVEKPAASKVETLLSITKDVEEGRANMLKYKKAEIQFFMKTFLILKVILGLFLPLGVIAAKVLSWKAVTLSLMAFMLAKIIFVKNLISGQNTLTGAQHFSPPVYIHSASNELFWKRQADHPPAYT